MISSLQSCDRPNSGMFIAVAMCRKLRSSQARSAERDPVGQTLSIYPACPQAASATELGLVQQPQQMLGPVELVPPERLPPVAAFLTSDDSGPFGARFPVLQDVLKASEAGPIEARPKLVGFPKAWRFRWSNCPLVGFDPDRIINA
jgi:hypothetical protein